MCEKDFYKNNSFIGGQGYFATDYEESPRDQDREVEKVSQVGHTGNDRKRERVGSPGNVGALVPGAHAAAWQKDLQRFLEETESFAPARSRRVPRVSEASKVSLRVAASVAHRKQVRAQRAQN